VAPAPGMEVSLCGTKAARRTGEYFALAGWKGRPTSARCRHTHSAVTAEIDSTAQSAPLFCGHPRMGVVYKARQKSLDRIVVLKMLLLGSHAPPESVKRIRAEAVATAALQHPNIVAIHEVGLHQGQHFLVMDFVAGPAWPGSLRPTAAGALQGLDEGPKPRLPGEPEADDASVDDVWGRQQSTSADECGYQAEADWGSWVRGA